MEIIKSQKGKPQLLYEGYRYRVDRITNGELSFWRCVKRECAGRLKKKTDGSMEIITDHMHAPDIERNLSEKVKATIRERAENGVERPRQIILNSTAGVSLEAAHLLPSYSACQRTIERRRKRHDVNYTRPHIVADIILPDAMKKTIRSENFLLWDSGSQDTNRMFIFGTAANLQLLEKFSHWFMDGTFKIAPEMFLQVFTIHALIDNRSIPLIYVLMGTKTQVDYERVFRKILELRSTLAPTSILIDFEQATMRALSTVFPNASVLGCLFHLGQSLWRRIQGAGLTNSYRDDENIRMYCKMLIALSFIPQEDVGSAFDELCESKPNDLQCIYDYWEDTYIGRWRRNGRANPLFSIAMWNMRDRVVNNLPRTNNSIEGWHHAFQSSVACHHPSICTLIDHFRREQDFTEQTVSRIQSGIISSQAASKSKYVRLTRRLSAILPTYGERDLKEYLRAISHNIEL